MISFLYVVILLYDPPPGIYTLNYDGYGYRNYQENSPLAIADRFVESNIFENAQMGMAIKGVFDKRSAWEVTTTGAVFKFEKSKGEISGYQSIGNRRALFRMKIKKVDFSLLKLLHKSTGYILLESQELKVRINGDGIMMVKAQLELNCSLVIKFSAQYLGQNEFKDAYLFLDEKGGLGVYLFGNIYGQVDKRTAEFKIGAGGIIWFAVCPPKEYGMKQPSRIIFYWGEGREWDPPYPTIKELKRWCGVNEDSTTFKGVDGRWGTNPDRINYGDIIALTAGVNLWEFWHTGYTPKDGWNEFHNLLKRAHSMNKKVIFSVSPSQFYLGSRYYVPGLDYYLGDSSRPVLIKSMVQIYEGGKQWPPGNPEGENIDFFLRSVEQIVNNKRFWDDDTPDGIYIDGLYFLNIPQSYVLLRRVREILGEDRIICLHSAPLPGGDAFLPSIDAYADYILRGEGGREFYCESNYFKYFIRTYNISNAFGIFLNQRDENGNYNLLSQDSLKEFLSQNKLDVCFDSPILDLCARWDTTHNWRIYLKELMEFWRNRKIN